MDKPSKEKVAMKNRMTLHAVIGFICIFLALLSTFLAFAFGGNVHISVIVISAVGCIIIIIYAIKINAYRHPYLKGKYPSQPEIDSRILTYILICLIGLFFVFILVHEDPNLGFVGWSIAAIGCIFLVARIISCRRKEEDPLKQEVYTRMLKYMKWYLISLAILVIVIVIGTFFYFLNRY